jgi:N utilization substance protein A
MATNKEILAVVETVSNEKNVNKAVIFDAIEEALEAATKKKYAEIIDVDVTINQATGDFDTYRVWHVVASEEEIEEPGVQILLPNALEIDPEAVVGDSVRELIESVEFGRISAQTAKHIIVQKVKEAVRSQRAEALQAQMNQILLCTVKKVTRDFVVVDVGGNAEGVIPRDQMLPREAVRMGDRVRAYLYAIDLEISKGPQIFLSRTHIGMLTELFKIEVPEIGEDVIEIKFAARDPGSRSKIAVSTNDGRMDPVGACVGMRGSRVQAVSGELGGERIDIMLWDDSDVQFVINAMTPAEVVSIVVDEDAHAMDLAVKDHQLSQAIGRNGQNVRLASELTGWTLNVLSEEQANKKDNVESEQMVALFVRELEVDEATAITLVEEGFSTVEDLAYVSPADVEDVEGIAQEKLQELLQRAKDLVLTKAIVREEAFDRHQPAEDLQNIEGMTLDLAYKLAQKGVITQDDLAEQSIDELVEIDATITEEQAAKFIMLARAPWFEESNEEA